MAQTFTQRSMQEMQLTDLTSEQFMTIALRTSLTLGWVVARKSDASFTAYTNNGIFNWNAEVQLRLSNDVVHILSQSHNIRCIEPENDKINIHNFIRKFNEIKESMAAVELNPVYIGMQSNVA